MFKIPKKAPSMRPMFLLMLALEFGSLLTTSCGPKFFPKCGELGVECPPCTGEETYPNPCVSSPKQRDAGIMRPDR